MIDRSKFKLMDNIISPVYFFLAIVIMVSLYYFFKAHVYLNVVVLITITLHSTFSRQKLKELMSINEIAFYSTFLNLMCWVAAFTLFFSRNFKEVDGQIEKLQEYNYTLFDTINFISIVVWLLLCFYCPYKIFGNTQEIEKAIKENSFSTKKASEKSEASL